jgi:hypothetical protein
MAPQVWDQHIHLSPQEATVQLWQPEQLPRLSSPTKPGPHQGQQQEQQHGEQYQQLQPQQQQQQQRAWMESDQVRLTAALHMLP